MIEKLDRIKSSDPLNISTPVKRTHSSSSASSASFAGSVGAKASVGSGSMNSSGVDAASSVRSLLGAGQVSLLGVQELGDTLSRASRGKLRAEEALKKLDKIRLGLLAGVLPRSELVSLSEVVSQQKESIDDPVLSELLDEIDLRAKVELAKYLA